MRHHLLALSVLSIIFASFIILAVAFSHTPTSRTSTQTKPSVATVFAMGDSISTGTGMQKGELPLCGRTDFGYPAMVAAHYSAKLTSRSCDGARTTSGITEPQLFSTYGEQPPQLDELFAQPGKPTVITLTIGTNDVDHLGCPDGNCASDEAKANFDTKLAELTPRLSDIFASIQRQYKTNVPPVFATGYFAMYGSNLSCSDAAGVTAEKAAWMRARTTELNQTIKKAAARFDFTHYVAIDFSGHELCSASPWIQGFGDKAAYHQNKAGSQAYSRAVIAAIDQTLQ